MRCWQCGAPVREGAKICMFCGATLTTDDAGARPAQPGESASYRRGQSAPPHHPVPDAEPWDTSEESAAYPASRAPVREEPPRDRPRSRPIAREGNGFADPLDDPRAPRGLRNTPAGNRGGQRPSSPRGYGDEYAQEPPRSGRYHEDSVRRDSHGGYGYDGDDSETGEDVAPDPHGYRADPRRERRSQPMRNDDRYRPYPEDESTYMPASPPRNRQNERGTPRYNSRGESWGDDTGYGERAWDESAEFSAEYAASRQWNDYDSREGPTYDEDSREYWAPQQPGPLVPQGRRAPMPMPTPSRGGGNTRSSRGREPQRKGNRLPVMIVLALAAIAVIAIGFLKGPELLRRVTGRTAASGGQAYPTATTGPTPTVIPQFKDHVSTHALYAMNYPQSWQESSSSDSSTGLDYLDTYQQDSPYAVVRVERAASFDAVSDADIIKGEVTGGQQNHMTFTETPGTSTSTTLGGQTWMRKEYDVTTGAKNLHMVILACHHNGKGYALVLATGVQDYDSVTKAFFQPMLQSFRFLA